MRKKGFKSLLLWLVPFNLPQQFFVESFFHTKKEASIPEGAGKEKKEKKERKKIHVLSSDKPFRTGGL